MKSRPLLPVACVAFLSATLPLLAQSYTFTKVADTNMTAAGGSGNYASFAAMAVVDAGGHVAFMEGGLGANHGFYLHHGGTTTRVAVYADPVPSTAFNFTHHFAAPGNGLDAGRLAFKGGDYLNDHYGVYTYSGGTLTRVVDSTTAIPGGTGNFTNFSNGYVQGTNYAFTGLGISSQKGIYTSDGSTVTLIANNTTAVPGIGGSYSFGSRLAFDGSRLAFFANATGGSQPGNMLGSYSGGTLHTIATLGDSAPGAGTAFTSFTSPALDGTTVAFYGFYSGGAGVYTVPVEGGAFSRIADTTFLAPGVGTAFTSFDTPVADGGRIAFRATFTGGSGLYLYDGTNITSIINSTQLLDGKTVSSFVLAEGGLGGDYLAFRATFSDASSGIFYTQLTAIPEPSTYALLAGGLVLGLAAWRRRAGA